MSEPVQDPITSLDQIPGPWYVAHPSDLVNGLRVPSVFAVDDGNGITCSFYCRWCDKRHLHGLGEGHRVAHCLCDDSPLRLTGYNIKLVDVEPPPPRRRFKRYFGDGPTKPYLSGLVRARERARLRPRPGR